MYSIFFATYILQAAKQHKQHKSTFKKNVLCVITSFPTQAQKSIFYRVYGLSSSAAIMGRMHAPG